MLIRITLIIAIVASLATAGISFVKVKEKIETLKSDRDKERTDKEAAQRDLSNTRKDLATTKKDLDKTKADLATTTSERDTAVAAAAAEQKRATELTDKLAKSTEDLNNTQQKLSQYEALATVDQLKSAMADAKALRLERTNLQSSLTRTQRELAATKKTLEQLTGEGDKIIPLPPDLRGKIVAVDPKYDFVVLNIGDKQGLLQDGILLVNRNGKLVAKLRVRSVQEDRSIANVIPGWKLGEVMEGDSVLPGI